MKNLWKGIAITGIFTSVAYVGGNAAIGLGFFGTFAVICICLAD